MSGLSDIVPATDTEDVGGDGQKERNTVEVAGVQPLSALPDEGSSSSSNTVPPAKEAEDPGTNLDIPVAIRPVETYEDGMELLERPEDDRLIPAIRETYQAEDLQRMNFESLLEPREPPHFARFTQSQIDPSSNQLGISRLLASPNKKNQNEVEHEHVGRDEGLINRGEQLEQGQRVTANEERTYMGPELHRSLPRGSNFDSIISSMAQLPGPIGQPNSAVLRESLLSVTCTFGLMRPGGWNYPRTLSFVSESFGPTEASSFTAKMRSHAAFSAGLMLLVVTDWQPWFLAHLEEAIPRFPIQSVLYMNESRTTTMLPLLDREQGGEFSNGKVVSIANSLTRIYLSCIMEHINIVADDEEQNEKDFQIGTIKVESSQLVVWSSAKNAILQHSQRPFVVVISSASERISSKIEQHYSQTKYERWDRLKDNQTWIYLDLYFLFTGWDRVWGAVKQNLNTRTSEVYTRKSALSIIDENRRLHRDNNVMISLREHLRIHKASLNVVIQRMKEPLQSPLWQNSSILLTRLDDAFQLLDYYDVTATSLLEQQQNILSLAFNLETVMQGQAVARLNALAFIFLPLSFVASVFGITTFTASLKWYPVVAVPVLFATITIAFVVNKIIVTGESKPSAPLSDDIERHAYRNWSPIVTSWIRHTWSNVTQGQKKTARALNTFEMLPAEVSDLNDPSRISKPVRTATQQSLEETGFIPPRSTVQFLPRASVYDLHNAHSTSSHHASDASRVSTSSSTLREPSISQPRIGNPHPRYQVIPEESEIAIDPIPYRR